MIDVFPWMSSIKNPLEKKRLAYLKDHYVRGGESDKNWRKTKPLKKAKANRAFRKKTNGLLPVCIDDETAPVASIRKLEGARKKAVSQMGAVHLKQFVARRKAKREAMIGARKRRFAKH